MKVQIKTVEVTRSVLKQLDTVNYDATILSDKNLEVLGRVSASVLGNPDEGDYLLATYKNVPFIWKWASMQINRETFNSYPKLVF